MNELSYAETTMVVIALRELMKKTPELPYSDKMVAEGLLRKLLISQKALRIRDALRKE